MNPVIKVENVSKQYRLGTVGTGTFANDMNRWWHTVRGKEDPYLKIGEANDRSKKGTSKYVWALRDINFEVQQGEVLGIIGKNGAGKSTLLKILSRVTAPTTGRISARGRIASLLEVGTGFHPELTGRENIFLNGAIMGMTKMEINSKLDEIIDFSGCERYIDTPVKRYSSGMYVRLAFAVAAHLEPEILIVDEVLAVGDVEFQKKAIGKMKDVSSQDGRTVLFVSHNMASIENLCSQCIFLDNGTVKEIGKTVDIIESYIATEAASDIAPLYERRDRKGNQKINLLDINFYNHKGESVNAVKSGQDLVVKIKYKSEENYDFNRIKISFGIRNSKEVVLFTCPSNVFEFNEKIELEGEFVLTIPKIPLPEGIYTFNLFIQVNNEVSDWIQKAGNLVVIGGDYYHTGILPPKSHDGVLIDYKWETSNA